MRKAGFNTPSKPATPLPWAVGKDWSTHNRPTRFWETGIDNGDVPVADTCGASQQEARQDAQYIVQAANAYPKLVEALRKVANAMVPPSETHHSDEIDAAQHEARILLRDLGEDA